MNLLLEQGLPEQLCGVPIYPDFRNMIRFELALLDDSIADQDRALVGIDQLFGEMPPCGLEEAVRALLWFYLRGKGPESGKGKAAARAYDFEQDAGRIYAAFLAVYGMDLTQVEYLHWWAFMALLEALPDTTQMGQIMAWRTVDLDGIKDKATRAHYAELKRRYAVQRKGRALPAGTAGEREQRLKARAAGRFEEAKRNAALR